MVEGDQGQRGNSRLEDAMKINLGCGLNKKPGYVNVDKFGEPIGRSVVVTGSFTNVMPILLVALRYSMKWSSFSCIKMFLKN